MELMHLTDTEIQDVLDGNRFPNQGQVLRHLEECENCKGSLEQYQRLYAELEQPLQAALQPGFAARMADQFEAAYARSQDSSLFDRLLWSGIGIAAVIAVYFFTDLSSVARVFEGFTMWQSLFSSEQLSTWGKMLQEYSIDPSVVAMAALALIVFGNMDTIIKHFRNRTPMCM